MRFSLSVSLSPLTIFCISPFCEKLKHMHYLQLSIPIQLLFFTISFYVNISFYMVMAKGFKASEATWKQLRRKRSKGRNRKLKLSICHTAVQVYQADGYTAIWLPQEGFNVYFILCKTHSLPNQQQKYQGFNFYFLDWGEKKVEQKPVTWVYINMALAKLLLF